MAAQVAKKRKAVVVVVYDVYSAIHGQGEQSVKRAVYFLEHGLTEGHMASLFGIHGNTDLRYTILQGKKWVGAGRFDDKGSPYLR
jgi:hypothetical protein